MCVWFKGRNKKKNRNLNFCISCSSKNVYMHTLQNTKMSGTNVQLVCCYNIKDILLWKHGVTSSICQLNLCTNNVLLQVVSGNIINFLRAHNHHLTTTWFNIFLSLFLHSKFYHFHFKTLKEKHDRRMLPTWCSDFLTSWKFQYFNIMQVQWF